MEPVLKIENLRTSFMTSSGEVQAVRGVSFSVEKGEILGDPIFGAALSQFPKMVDEYLSK